MTGPWVVAAVLICAIAIVAVFIQVAARRKQAVDRPMMPALGAPDAVAFRWDAALERCLAVPIGVREPIADLIVGGEPPRTDQRTALFALREVIDEVIALSHQPPPRWWAGGAPSAELAARPNKVIYKLERVLAAECALRAADGDAAGAAEVIAARIAMARLRGSPCMSSTLATRLVLGRVRASVTAGVDRGELDRAAIEHILGALVAAAPALLPDARTMFEAEIQLQTVIAASATSADRRAARASGRIFGIAVPWTMRSYLEHTLRARARLVEILSLPIEADRGARRAGLRAISSSEPRRSAAAVEVGHASFFMDTCDELRLMHGDLLQRLRPIADRAIDVASLRNGAGDVWAAVRLVDLMEAGPRDTLTRVARHDSSHLSPADLQVALQAFDTEEKGLLERVEAAGAAPHCDLRAPADRDVPIVMLGLEIIRGKYADTCQGMIELRRLLDVLSGGARLRANVGDHDGAARAAASALQLVLALRSATIDVSLVAQAALAQLVPVCKELRDEHLVALVGSFDPADPLKRVTSLQRTRAELTRALSWRAIGRGSIEHLTDAIAEAAPDQLAGLALAGALDHQVFRAGEPLIPAMDQPSDQWWGSLREAAFDPFAPELLSLELPSGLESTRRWCESIGDTTKSGSRAPRTLPPTLPLAQVDERAREIVRSLRESQPR